MTDPHLPFCRPPALAAPRVARRRRAAFTLVEMLVSIAVLSVALTIVGWVFSYTARAAGQSAAYSETLAYLRQVTTQLEEDLRNVDPAQSVLVLVGRTQPAALSRDDIDAAVYYRLLVGDPNAVPAGYDPATATDLDIPGDPLNSQYSDPRADILMFFTNRPTASTAPPPNPDASNPFAVALANGARLAPVQVVYGHAALGSPAPSGVSWAFPPDSALRHIEQTVTIAGSANISALPLIDWRLARRQVIIDPNAPATKLTFDDTDWTRISRCDPNADSLGLPGDAAELNYSEFLRDLSPDSFTLADDVGPAAYTPYAFDVASGGYPPWNSEFVSRVYSLLYPSGNTANRHIATVLDDTPVDLRTNRGVQMLAGCVWFQVEFLMPEDARNSLAWPNDPNARSHRTDMPRWSVVEPGATYAFVPDTEANRRVIREQSPGANQSTDRLWTYSRLDQDPLKHLDTGKYAVEQRVVRMWPYAIRVTVRAIDPRNRLDGPITRTIVHRFEN